MTTGISGIQADLVSKNVVTSNRTVTTPSNGTIADYRQALTEAIREKDIASEMLKENEKDIKELEAEIEDIKEQINETMAQAINDGEQLTEEEQNNVDNAITQTIAKYVKGEISKDELMETLQSSLANSESAMASKLNNLMTAGDPLIEKLEGMMSNLCDLYSQNEELKQRIINADKTIKECTQKIEEESKKDPIGFEKDNITYDFIIDRDNDGQFDGSNEFLGAENGFEEMKAYDKDGNGLIEGEELNNMQMIKTDKNTGKQSFVSAQEAGVTQIDLASYEKTGYTQANGNEHLGSFNIEAQGETIEGYQTLDNVDWLDANYGNSYGKSINGNQEVQTTPKSNVQNVQGIKNKAIVKNDVKTQIKNVQNAQENILSMINTAINDNSQQIANAQTNINEEDTNENGKSETNKQKTTSSFMAMAYSYNADFFKKKQEVA